MARHNHGRTGSILTLMVMSHQGGVSTVVGL
jgi:hypothetical protein